MRLAPSLAKSTTNICSRKRMGFSLKPSLDMIAKYTDPVTDARPTPPEAAIGTVWVDFNGDPSIGVKQIRAFAQHIDQHNFYTGIYVTAASVSSSCYKIAATVAPKILEIFLESDLLVNITMHELVPKHVLLSKEEKMKLLERYRLKESQLPRIQASDPVARYLGLRRGQVVKIIRKSTTAGRYASYRWCI
jgi:DNA-directed RNA polymerases I, II, and III subunit RPABC1